jgi:hypothetical protein
MYDGIAKIRPGVGVRPISSCFLRGFVMPFRRYVPIAGIRIIEWLTISPLIIRHTVVMHFLWLRALQYTFIQAFFLGFIISHSAAHAFVTEPEDEVAFVMGCHGNLEFYFLSSIKLRVSYITRRRSPIQEFGPATSVQRVKSTHALGFIPGRWCVALIFCGT